MPQMGGGANKYSDLAKGMLAAEQQETQHKTMDATAVRKAYKRQAPFYDYSFGMVSAISRKRTVEEINQRRGRVLEVGVGTGLSLPNYAPYLKVSGIDLSPEMLAKAHERVEKAGLSNVEDLLEMDASNLELPDNSYNVVVAMYVLSVVPDPEKVMKELARVCAPGGEVMAINHFSQDHGVRGWAERKLAPYSGVVGW
ncbi:MAG: methyltransferase domain-containing protein, partial [Alphaproteobacteria bacterium]